MARLHERAAPMLTGIVDEFYDRMLVHPRVADVLGRLSPDELSMLMVKQVEHLGRIISPAVADRVLRDRSREIGRVHAMVGVEIDRYVEAVTDHRRTLLELAGEIFEGEDRALAHTFVGDRCMHDLQGALLGYRDLDNARHRVMLSLTQAMTDARTVADLARGVVEALSCLQGVSVAFFGRPDATGRLRMEIGAGAGLEALADEGPDGLPVVAGHGVDDTAHPAEVAWLTGTIERCDSYVVDPEAEGASDADADADAVPWRELASRHGWRSSVALPLSDRRGASIALLMLHAYWPGYFASDAVMTMLRQVKQSLEAALSEIEERPTLASAVSGYADRVDHINRLRNGSVEMLYQPVISLPDGGLTKLEALARLREDGRRISPAEFLPAFGDDELYDLFEQGLHQSLDAVRTWQSAGLLTGVSVNLPVVSPQDDRYSRVVAELLQKYDVEAARLTLELLETGFVDREAGQQLRWLEEFKGLGVRLAQDDLGSGYSSLLRLRHFAFDDVKIDQSLVRGTELAPGAALHFIEPINDIAHSLGLSVVIEGLEDAGLVEAGIQLAVDEGQGYGIAPPMPADKVVEWNGNFHLDLDPLRPRTPVGALAAHVCWEHRITALGYHHFRGTVLDLGTCALSPYLDELGSSEAVEAHQTVHGEAVVSRGSEAHRASWDLLAGLVSELSG
jgi:EAL domain-containing protein (putative c-di-GMP-specific phosphodiesterase class I)